MQCTKKVLPIYHLLAEDANPQVEDEVKNDQEEDSWLNLSNESPSIGESDKPGTILDEDLKPSDYENNVALLFPIRPLISEEFNIYKPLKLNSTQELIF